MNVFLWVIVPYLCLAVFVVGHVWRYRYDKFGWTTRSSQLYEDRLLRLGSPLFHFGMLGVVGGHVIGLLIPRSWTEAVGIDDHLYHYVAVIGGLVAGVVALVGMAILVYRGSPLAVYTGQNMFLRNFANAKGGVPYGIALGIGGLVTYPGSPLMVWAMERLATQ